MKEFISTRVAASIERAALQAGRFGIDGNKLDTFDAKLMVVGEGSLSEHLDIQASARLYYTFVLDVVTRKRDLVERKYKEWYGKVYRKVYGELLDESKYKPIERDVTAEVPLRFPRKYRKWRQRLEKIRHEWQVISSWVEAWNQKSFSMDGIGKEKRGFEEEDVMEKKDVRKNIRRHLTRGKKGKGRG